MRSQPPWAWQAALGAAVLVVLVPLVLMTLAALVVGIVVFGLLLLVWAATSGIRRLWDRTATAVSWPRADGRRNVRVVHRR